MPQYSPDSFEKVSELLAHLSARQGATAYTLQGDVIPLRVAMDPVGPMTWALVMHADILARLGGVSKDGHNMLPFTCAVNPESPFGNQAMLQASNLSIAMAMPFLDAALEHAIALGIQAMGYTFDEWIKLPEDNQVIAIEPYFNDLKTRWITDVMEGDDKAEIVNAWPSLQVLTKGDAPSQALTDDAASSPVIQFHSMRMR